MPKTFTVRDLPLEERPRERLVKHGAENISAQELLAVVLGRGVSGRSVMSIAQTLISTFGSLEKIVSAPLVALEKIDGLGRAKALQLKASLEIARRVNLEEADQEQNRNKESSVASPEDIARLIKPLIRNWNKEHFYAVSFDNRNRALSVDLIGVGTLNSNLVHPRETFSLAISHSASHIAVAHNHPSGDPQPSQADITVTKRLADAGKLMGIQLLDHVIISKTTLFSCKENGLI